MKQNDISLKSDEASKILSSIPIIESKNEESESSDSNIKLDETHWKKIMNQWHLSKQQNQ